MATRIFNVRLTDEEYAALGRVAEERGLSMSGLVKDWITHSPTLATMDEMAGAGKAHVACDAEIARLKAELAGRQVSTKAVDVSTSLGAALAETRALAVNQDEAEVAAAAEAAVQDVRSGPPYPLAPALISVPRPAFLAAKVDDCVSCGHEWHSNEDGGCKAAKGPRDRCGCKAYLNEGEPF